MIIAWDEGPAVLKGVHASRFKGRACKLVHYSMMCTSNSQDDSNWYELTTYDSMMMMSVDPTSGPLHENLIIVIHESPS